MFIYFIKPLYVQKGLVLHCTMKSPICQKYQLNEWILIKEIKQQSNGVTWTSLTGYCLICCQSLSTVSHMSDAHHSSTESPQHVNSILPIKYSFAIVFSIKQYRLCHSVALLMGYVNVCSCAVYGGTGEWGLKFANCCGEGKRIINSESAMSDITAATGK